VFSLETYIRKKYFKRCEKIWKKVSQYFTSIKNNSIPTGKQVSHSRLLEKKQNLTYIYTEEAVHYIVTSLEAVL
jgi:hypothetical protein